MSSLNFITVYNGDHALCAEDASLVLTHIRPCRAARAVTLLMAATFRSVSTEAAAASAHPTSASSDGESERRESIAYEAQATTLSRTQLASQGCTDAGMSSAEPSSARALRASDAAAFSTAH